MVMVGVLDPAVLLAVIVYVVTLCATVGVPVIAPVDVLKLNPAGNAELIEYPPTTAPPEFDGVHVVIVVPTVYVLLVGE